MQPEYNEIIARLDERVKVYEKIIASMKDQIDTVHRDVVKLSLDIANSGKTKWGIMISFAGLVVAVMSTIGGMAITPIQKDIIRIDAEQQRLDTRINDNQKIIDSKIEARNAAIDAAIRDVNTRKKQ